jgi:DNA ligase-associated metallophosphoesterase
MKPRTIILKQTELLLLPEKALLLPEYKTLCIADWHLGKAAHFRKSGIALPQPDLSPEFEQVSRLIGQYEAEQVVLLGDLFHSHLNKDWIRFGEFIHAHSNIRWTITMGNHDIIGKEQFTSLGIHALDELVLGERVICTHHPLENLAENQLNIAGHIHPGCELFTPTRQKFKLPCFHYANQVLTLPAFGSLTGLFILKPAPHNRIFPILGDEVMEWTFKE